jgi:hypothetical protein
MELPDMGHFMDEDVPRPLGIAGYGRLQRLCVRQVPVHGLADVDEVLQPVESLGRGTLEEIVEAAIDRPDRAFVAQAVGYADRIERRQRLVKGVPRQIALAGPELPEELGRPEQGHVFLHVV